MVSAEIDAPAVKKASGFGATLTVIGMNSIAMLRNMMNVTADPRLPVYCGFSNEII